MTDTTEVDQSPEGKVKSKANMVFMIDKIPEEVKAGLDDENMETYVECILSKKGIKTERVERGVFKEKKPHLHNLVFISAIVEEEEAITGLVEELNKENNWQCFEIGRKRQAKATGPRMNVVFMTDTVPDEVKAGVEEGKLDQFIVDKLKEAGEDVLHVRKGHTKYEDIIFISLNHEDEAELGEVITKLNPMFWEGLEMSREWWKTQNSKRKAQGENIEGDTGPETNMVFFINKIPEEAKKDMINDDTVLEMDFEKYVKTKLKERGHEVLKCHQGFKSSHVIFLTIDVEDKEKLPEVVEALNEEFWGCFEVGNHKKRFGKIHCDICKVTLRNERLMEVHKTGKHHMRRLNRLDENGSLKTYKCDLCLIQTNDQNGLDIHLQGKPHLKKVAQTGQKVFKCDLCCVTTNCQSGMDVHVKGKQHQKKLESNNPGTITQIPVMINNIVPEDTENMASNTVRVANIELAPKPKLVPVVPKPMSQGFSCELCQITTTSADSLNMHLMGAKHKKKLGNGAKRKMNENNGMEEFISQEIKKIKQENGAQGSINAQ